MSIGVLMERNHNLPPTILVVFGASGDLTHRKLIPAVYNLFLDGVLPAEFAVLGLDRQEMSDEAFRQHLRQGVDEFSRRGKADEATWNKLAGHSFFGTADFADKAAFTDMAATLKT